jgi:hypothetical protein
MKNSRNQIIERKTSPTPQFSASIGGTFQIAGHGSGNGHNPCRHAAIMSPTQRISAYHPSRMTIRAPPIATIVTERLHRRSCGDEPP